MSFLRPEGVGAQPIFVARFLPFVLALPLVGCMTDGPLIPDPFGPTKAELEIKKAQLDAKDDEVCKGDGAKPGTDIYIQCRMSQSQQRVTAESAPGPVIINNQAPEPASYPKLAPINYGTRCTARGC
jgi:hypothetical protein